MAVVDIMEGFTGMEAGGDDQARRATRVFTILTDGTPARALFEFPLASGSVEIPAPGAAHPDNPWYRSGVPQVTATTNPRLWDVKVPYSTERGKHDPLSEPAEISWDDAVRTVPFDRDADGFPIWNVLLAPYDPPPTDEVSDPVLIIERNQGAFSPQTKLDYQDTVATEAFYGSPAGRARLKFIKARMIHAEDLGLTYWKVRYEIHFRMKIPKGTPDAMAWFLCLLNQGVIYLGDDGRERPTPNHEVRPLDEEGYLTDRDNPFWLYFRRYPDKAWTPLGLPQP